MDQEIYPDRPAIDWTQTTFHRIQAAPVPTNHNLMYIQREQHQKKLRTLKPPEPIERLYQLDATRRQALDVLKDEEGTRKNYPECSWKPEIDKNSEKLSERLDPKVVNRVYHWQQNRDQKLKSAQERTKGERERQLQEDTQQYKYVNGNFEVDSKVRNFVESLDHRNKVQAVKKVYQSQANPPAYTGYEAHGGQEGDNVFKSPIQYMSEPIERHVGSRSGSGGRVMATVPGGPPLGESGAFLKKSGVKKVTVGQELQQPKKVDRQFVRTLIKDI